MLKFTKILSMGLLVAALGLLVSSCVVDEDYYVRYTWRSVDVAGTTYTGNGTPLAYKISSIAASEYDVKGWKDDWYKDVDATDIPLYAGSPDIPNNIYSSTLLNYTQYKGVNLPISEGSYTAVCSVEDITFNNVVDIVANYKVPFNSSNGNYTEVDFYVAEAIASTAGTDDSYARSWGFSDPDIAPTLNKTPAKSLVKTFEKDNVTYYVIRRPKK